MVDSIGTLLIAGLPERANMARQYIAEQLSFKKNVNAGVFEANIRYVFILLECFCLLLGPKPYSACWAVCYRLSN